MSEEKERPPPASPAANYVEERERRSMKEEPAPEDRYEITIAWSVEDGVFVARVTEMPYTGAHGDTPEEALDQVRAAIRACLQVAEERGMPVPEPSGVRRKGSG